MPENVLLGMCMLLETTWSSLCLTATVMEKAWMDCAAGQSRCREETLAAPLQPTGSSIACDAHPPLAAWKTIVFPDKIVVESHSASHGSQTRFKDADRPAGPHYWGSHAYSSKQGPGHPTERPAGFLALHASNAARGLLPLRILLRDPEVALNHSLYLIECAFKANAATAAGCSHGTVSCACVAHFPAECVASHCSTEHNYHICLCCGLRLW